MAEDEADEENSPDEDTTSASEVRNRLIAVMAQVLIGEERNCVVDPPNLKPSKCSLALGTGAACTLCREPWIYA